MIYVEAPAVNIDFFVVASNGAIFANNLFPSGNPIAGVPDLLISLPLEITVEEPMFILPKIFALDELARTAAEFSLTTFNFAAVPVPTIGESTG